MPSMANITLNNYAASPVTYTVLSINSGVAQWADVTQGTPGGFRTVSEELRRPSDPSKGVTRILFKIARPYVNATTGLVDYTLRWNSDIIVPVMSSLAERQELYAMGKNFAAHANALAAVKDIEGMF